MGLTAADSTTSTDEVEQFKLMPRTTLNRINNIWEEMKRIKRVRTIRLINAKPRIDTSNLRLPRRGGGSGGGGLSMYGRIHRWRAIIQFHWSVSFHCVPPPPPLPVNSRFGSEVWAEKWMRRLSPMVEPKDPPRGRSSTTSIWFLRSCSSSSGKRFRGSGSVLI